MDDIEKRDDELETSVTNDEEVETATVEDEDEELEDALDNGDVPEGAVEVPATEMAQYEITGLVDFSDEQGNIRGQLPVGSIQSLPIVVGDKAVADGQAKRVE